MLQKTSILTSLDIAFRQCSCPISSYDSFLYHIRCYNLGDPIQREEFTDDFKLTAAINVIKHSVLIEVGDLKDSSGIFNGEVQERILKDAIHACNCYINFKATGFDSLEQQHNISNTGVKNGREKPFKWGENNVSSSGTSIYGGVPMPCGESEISTSDRLYGLLETTWQSILKTSYKIANQTVNSIFTKQNSFNLNNLIQGKGNNHISTHVLSSIFLLRKLKVLRKQFYLDGMKNIWIVKAPDVSRGVGMQVLYRLEDILECERGMSCRTVQKYTENPLLARSVSKFPSTTNAPRNRLLQNVHESEYNCNSNITNERSKITPVISHNQDDNVTSITDTRQMLDDIYKRNSVEDAKIDVKNMDSLHATHMAFPYRRKNRKAAKKLSFLMESIQKNGNKEENKRNNIADLGGENDRMRKGSVKFDLRVWVLVTSFEPR